ncbi:MAG: lauroyl acyltransferase [Azospirillum sp.]|nr:lauroyl acyltransferase [Azospirillum sp.]
MANRSATARWWRRRLFYPLQTVLAHLVFAVFGMLPPAVASALGGWLGRSIGPRLGASKKALSNLQRALPALPPERHRAILGGMWDNLGRVIAEYPHLRTLAETGPGKPLEIVGLEHLHALRDDGRAGFLFSGHLANWEILGVAARRLGVELTLVYRAPNNPSFDRLLRRARGVPPEQLVPKGAAGASALLRALRRGGHVAMLVDQKMNDGVAVPFFGREVMTAPALAQLALRYRLPVVPVRVERLGGIRCRVTLSPPLTLPDSGDRHADTLAAMTEVNALLESWIRERPEQWLWLHRRWPD